MPVDIQTKLNNFELPPPPGTWATISAALDREFTPADTALANRAEAIRIAPPAEAWSQIEQALDKRPDEAKTPVIAIRFSRIAAAAAVAVLVAAAALYLSRSQGIDHNRSVLQLARNNPGIQHTAPAHQVPSPAAEITSRPVASMIRSNARSNVFYARQPVAVREDAEDTPGMVGETCYTDLQTVQADQRVTVPARPIRDERGNIVMDMHLIRKAGNPYITVTSPNGDQTRISSKFIALLAVLNSDGVADGDDEDQAWQKRFQSWREKLLQEDAFIPAAGNFFDIFALKDMIQE